MRRNDHGCLDRRHWSDASATRDDLGVDTPGMELWRRACRGEREVRADPGRYGTFRADDGMPVGLRVWKKIPVVSDSGRVKENSPGRIERLSSTERAHMARTEDDHHVVFFSEEYVASLQFFRDRSRVRLYHIWRVA